MRASAGAASARSPRPAGPFTPPLPEALFQPMNAPDAVLRHLAALGLDATQTVYYNLPAPALIEEALRRGEGRLVAHGPLATRTDPTGRSPNDRFVVDEPSSGEDRVGEVPDVRDCPPLQGLPIHKTRVQLGQAVAIEHGSAAGIERRMVLHRRDHLGDHVEGRPPTLQRALPDPERPLHPLQVSVSLVGGDVPRAAVDEEERRLGDDLPGRDGRH